MTNFVHPYTFHPQKWTTDLLFKDNRIRKHVTIFKNPLPRFCEDIMVLKDIWKKQKIWRLVDMPCGFLNL